MKNRFKNNLQTRLEGLSPAERRKLYKRASRLRSAALEKDRTTSRKPGPRNALRWGADEDDDPVTARRSSRRRGSLEDWVEKILDEEQAGRDCRSEETEGSLITGTVLSALSTTCMVLSRDQEIRCTLAQTISAARKSDLAVGDSVRVAVRSNGTGIVQFVLPRRTVLSRPDPEIPQRERAIAANIDAVVIVASIRAPMLRVRLIDRFLIAIQRGGAEPVLCVNKIDLAESGDERCEELSKLRPYEGIGVRILPVSAATREGLSDLAAAIRGRRSLFVGHSGVGKSSLLNALDPALLIPTGGLTAATSKGKHTTSAVTLHRLPDGTDIIDTPGIRQLGLWEVGQSELQGYFPEFEPQAVRCRFKDCSHLHEPDCGVRGAVLAGLIHRARYDTYIRIMASL